MRQDTETTVDGGPWNLDWILPQHPTRRQERRRFRLWALIVCLAILDLGMAWLAYWTLGAMGGGLWLLLCLVNVPVLLLAAFWRPSVAAALAVVLAVVLVPLPVQRGLRLQALSAEAASVVDFARAHQARADKFPVSLAEYRSARPELHRLLRYAPTADGFVVQIGVDETFGVSYRCFYPADLVSRGLGSASGAGSSGDAPCSRRQDWYFESD